MRVRVRETILPHPHSYPDRWSRVWRRLIRLNRVRRGGWIDLLLVLGMAGLLFGLVDLFGEATAVHRPKVEIDLSPWALPRYTFLLVHPRHGRLRPVADVHAGLRLLGGQGPRRPSGS